MAVPFLSEIRMMSFQFPPKGWALCNGQLLPINQNQALFALLGTTYGGNGQTNFALPNLQGRVPVHVGSGFTLGQLGGETSHTLSVNEMPLHAHPLNASAAPATAITPTNLVLAAPSAPLYAAAGSPQTALSPSALTPTGGSQPHENMPPYLTISFCIALQGIFPSQN